MQNIVLGKDDSFTSPIERIFIATNGPAGGCQNPLRQGLSADLADGARPNNVLGGIPTVATDYSPVWDAQLFSWTQDAINQGFRGQVREEFQILIFVQDGLITGRAAISSGVAASQLIALSPSDSINRLGTERPPAVSICEHGGHFKLRGKDMKWTTGFLAGGATETMAVADQFDGDRRGTLTDPFGHVWLLAPKRKKCQSKSGEAGSQR
jgi:hypothetical protein